MTDKANLYQLDGRVPVLTAIPFGLQHVLAMFVTLRLLLFWPTWLASTRQSAPR